MLRREVPIKKKKKKVCLRVIYLPGMFKNTQRSGKSETGRAAISEGCWLQAHAEGSEGPCLIILVSFGREGEMAELHA